MSEKVYKLRHKPTGLFYKPTRGYYKTNLSEKGKIYTERSFPKYEITGSMSPTLSIKLGLKSSLILGIKKEDWEIVEYELKEIK